jgi:hypothetical protein
MGDIVRHRIVGLLIAFVIFLPCASSSEVTQKSISPETPVRAVRDFVLSYFNPVRGTITGVKDGFVSVDLGIDKEVKGGTRLFVFRQGSPFYHPTTKEMIGKVEDKVGRVEIKKRDAKGIYDCLVINGDLKKGDIVRISSSKIKLAFFQDRKSDWELSEVFYKSLKDSQRFEILESYTRDYRAEALSGLAKELGAEAFLIFSTTSREGRIFFNVKLFWVEDTHFFTEMGGAAGSEIEEELISEASLLDINITGREPWGSYNLKDGELIAVGDVDGNGTRELVVSDGTNLRIYDMKEKPQEIWFIKGEPHERHLSIDIHDINANGRDEIFVTSLIDDKSRMSSFVVEYDLSNEYRRIWVKSPYFLRVAGETLLMQKFTRFGIFSGPLLKGVWKDGSYQPEGTVKLPDGVNIYGFVFIDWHKEGHPQLMTFDDKGYLNLYEKGQSIWKSEDTYGEFNLSFLKDRKTIFDRSSERDSRSLTNDEEKWYVRARLVPVKTARGQEVIVVKNVPVLANMPGLGTGRSEIYALWWNGDTMDEELVMRGISGAVTDIQLDGSELFIISGSSVSAFIKEAFTGHLLKGSRLYYYKFIKK